MKKRLLNWQVTLGIGLIALTTLLYFVHYLIFRDAHHIFFYLLSDIAFLPLEVLLVTMVIHRLLDLKEKQIMLEKLNMLIGVFFSQVGNSLLSKFAGFDSNVDQIRHQLTVSDKWTEANFLEVLKNLRNYSDQIHIEIDDLKELRTYLANNRMFLINLLENPNLFEHETFTELLRAVFHLVEELDCRTELPSCPITDLEHLTIDIKRAYTLLIFEWLEYMRYIKSNYPYLFSLSMRTSPFDKDASAVVLLVDK